MALTYLDAAYRDGFETCTAVPCTMPADRTTVPAGNRIAGTMAQSAFTALAWRAFDSTELAAEVRLQGDMPVNDRNSDFSSTAWVGALRASHTFALGPGTLSLLARLDNLSGLRYAGAVIVNDVNGREARQPERPALRRCSDRERRQRSLLRNRVGPHLVAGGALAGAVLVVRSSNTVTSRSFQQYSY